MEDPLRARESAKSKRLAMTQRLDGTSGAEGGGGGRNSLFATASSSVLNFCCFLVFIHIRSHAIHSQFPIISCVLKASALFALKTRTLGTSDAILMDGNETATTPTAAAAAPEGPAAKDIASFLVSMRRRQAAYVEGASMAASAGNEEEMHAATN
jgi:hypothetical protein